MAAQKGLYYNINKRKKEGKAPLKPSSDNYPTDKAFADSAKTAKEEYAAEGKMETARDNVGADKCWDGYKAKGTKKKNGKLVPNCVKEKKTFAEFCVEADEIAEGYKELPKRKMGMKAGKKIISAVGHAAKAGEHTDERDIEPQIRTQKANKKAKQAEKIHAVAKNHSPAKAKLKNIRNNLKGMANEGVQILDADGNVFAEVVDLIKPEPMTGWRQQVMSEISEESQEWVSGALSAKKPQ